METNKITWNKKNCSTYVKSLDRRWLQFFLRASQQTCLHILNINGLVLGCKVIPQSPPDGNRQTKQTENKTWTWFKRKKMHFFEFNWNCVTQIKKNMQIIKNLNKIRKVDSSVECFALQLHLHDHDFMLMQFCTCIQLTHDMKSIKCGQHFTSKQCKCLINRIIRTLLKEKKNAIVENCSLRLLLFFIIWQWERVKVLFSCRTYKSSCLAYKINPIF